MAANNPLFDFSQPRVMAILNVTPDSFFAGSRMPDATHVERRVKEAAAEGASIIDVGGYSSRPGADEVPVDEEWRRVELGIKTVGEYEAVAKLHKEVKAVIKFSVTAAE